MLLKDKLSDRRLILGSASPRRRQLLADAGLPFEVAEPFEVEEVWPAGVPVESVAEYLAVLKSEGYPRSLVPEEILLTADTTVVLGGEVLGKPAGRAEALAMLEKLSGKRHEVITGVCLRLGNGRGEGQGTETRVSFSVGTRVWFRELAREEMEFYVDTFEPFDKAGAYGIQEWIGHVGITRIDGSFHNVMGLPIQRIYAKLSEII